MTLPQTVIAREARVLLDAERRRVPVEPLTARLPGITIVDAYAIQREVVGSYLNDGDRVIGRKVGLTSAAMQDMLGVGEPDYGVILKRMALDRGDDILAAELIAPRIEAEIAFELAAPLAGEEVAADEVLAATGRVAAALEVIDSRIVDWRIAIEDTIADNASSARVVLGEWRAADGVDLEGEAVELRVGGRQVEGAGAAVLGHPAAAVAWLVRALAKHDEVLEAGTVVLPGAMAAALPIAAGDRVVAEYSSLGTIEVAVG